MSALGETFRTARESQGLSLADVADRTHIRSVYLAALEAEDWQAVGPAVYVRGFIRSYARFLGLDPDAAVARFSGTGAAGTSAPPVILAPSPRGEPSRSGLARGAPSRSSLPRGEPTGAGRKDTGARARGLSAWAIAGVAVAAVLVAFVGYQYYKFAQAPGARTGPPPLARAPASVVQSGARPVESPRPAASQVATELHAPVKNGLKSSGFAVRLRDSSWLRVTIDGKVMMEGLYPAGTLRSFAGHSATVRVGNAGGVSITVDGKDLGPMGGLGDVAERSFQL